ncbi:MAG: hypothetical protein Q7J07_06340 [Pelolinea sp.]|nr:hypothetical protein [Pelolinea sp.]
MDQPMDNTDMIGNTLQKFYFGIISCFFSIIVAGSVLGTAGLYKPEYVFPLVIISSLLIFVFLSRIRNIKGSQLLIEKDSQERVSSDYFVYLITFAIILLLILVPIIRWPESIAGDWFPWDAGKYHFPKAVEMVRSGSANDMTIAYSEYPFGYESLLSFCILLTGDASLFGWLHALIDLFFILSFWLLARRVTKINASSLLFLITLLILSNYFFRFLNLWQVFQPEMTTVGKNDLLLASSILTVLYFYPYPRSEDVVEQKYFVVGVAGMIALSVKPNAVYLLAPLWTILGGSILFKWVRNGFEATKSSTTSFIFASIIMIPGVIWLLRNLIITKKIFSEYVIEASKWSIAANLTNPYFYEYIPKNLILIIGLAVMMLLLSIKVTKYRWYVGIFLLLIFGFILTPVTAFFLRTDVPAVINWRFGEALLAYIFIMLLLLINDSLREFSWREKIKVKTDRLRVFCVLIIAMGVIWSQILVLQKKPENAIILKDQFRESVGVDGYYSAYDYVQKNVRNSVVWVENGLPYYVYGPDYTNTVSRKTSADYIVVIKTDWFGDGTMQIPNYFDPVLWEDSYQVVYEDPHGVVFALRK